LTIGKHECKLGDGLSGLSMAQHSSAQWSMECRIEICS
jgi:hypothetical protein